MTKQAAKVKVGSFQAKGRGLVADCGISKGEEILSSPVKLLNPVEFHLLRLAPLLLAHAQTRSDAGAPIGMQQLMASLGALLNEPDEVLASNAASDSSDAAIMYTFTWDRREAEGGQTAAIAFGLASLCNHASDHEAANADAVPVHDSLEIRLIAVKDIQPGDEILIRYRSTPFAD